MSGISIHVVDVSRGIVASSMRVDVDRVSPVRVPICSGAIAANGVLDEPALGVRFEPGVFEASFYVADYYWRAGIKLPSVPFLEIVTYRFGVADSNQHYHLPMKVTPWGYSCFRGGA